MGNTLDNNLISRQAALDCFTATKLKKFDFILYAREEIKNLPPVNPQPKTGHWIKEINDYGETIGWHCDKCYEDSGFTTDCKWDYCPNCGAKMEGEKCNI